MKKAITTLLLSAALIGSCGRTDEHGEMHAGPSGQSHEAAPAPAGLVAVDPEMLCELRITTAQAEARVGGEGVTVLGEVKVNEDAYAEVGSPIAARVVRVLGSPGNVVRPGQPLVELESVDLGKARADYLSARGRADLARQVLERKRALVGEHIAPERELEEAQAEATVGDANLRAARAALRALGVPEDDLDQGGDADALFTLRSPIAGTIIERNVVRGQMTDPSRSLYRVADLSRLWLTVHASERDAVRVQTGAAARVTFPALPGRTFLGTVALVGSQVDVGSRTIPVRIDVANGDGSLRPGMSASAWLPLGDAHTVVAVPSASLQRAQDAWCVFVPRDGRTFEMRTVRRGRDLGGEVEVVSGLRPGETVVVEGAFLLKAEAEKARGEGGSEER
jgi:membrane fusion protein, heavy metal efflux system